ncbi:hypothetical protein [Desulfobacterium sp. N47]|uniref:Uncharacterized protein n=1 Tax=uncultured Desulfobacterium sp. TaxID=201089 RepID=E1YGM2_9BACT|nr:hypothetical protein N47_F14110 [uncultured Desulfobacterium sp.]
MPIAGIARYRASAKIIGRIHNIYYPYLVGRYPNTVEARGVLCYWAARELGLSTLELSKKLGISQPTASQSAKRGEKIVKEKGLKIIG